MQKNVDFGAKKKRRLPTFPRPLTAVSSAQLRFTSEFGMGSGGSTALLSPQIFGNAEKPPTLILKMREKVTDIINQLTN